MSRVYKTLHPIVCNYMILEVLALFLLFKYVKSIDVDCDGGELK